MQRYSIAAKFHRNIVQELVKLKMIELLYMPILASADPTIGAYSYAIEITIDELKNQIKQCEDLKFKTELENLTNELIILYEKNKTDLYARWDNLRRIEKEVEILSSFFEKILFILKLAGVAILAWIVSIFI